MKLALMESNQGSTGADASSSGTLDRKKAAKPG
jgi:hypothetical protein